MSILLKDYYQNNAVLNFSNININLKENKMQAATKKTGGIKDMDKKYFREIFNLHAVDEKINYEGLCKIFEMVDFKPNEKQEQEFKAMFLKRDLLSFNGKR